MLVALLGFYFVILLFRFWSFLFILFFFNGIFDT